MHLCVYWKRFCVVANRSVFFVCTDFGLYTLFYYATMQLRLPRNKQKAKKSVQAGSHRDSHGFGAYKSLLETAFCADFFVYVNPIRFCVLRF